MKTAIASSVFLALLAVRSASADLAWHVEINVTGLPDLQFELALYDNSGILGDSYALVDNVALNGVLENFEGGTLGGFDSSLNPGSVTVVAGNLGFGGTQVMRIDEDPIFSPTITFRNMPTLADPTIEFDFQFLGSATAGFWGLDQLVVSILDPDTLAPLLPGLTLGFGDVLAADASGLRHTAAVGPSVVPAPGSTMLALIGMTALALVRGLRRS